MQTDKPSPESAAPSQPRLTEEEWKRAYAGALEDVRLNAEQCPPKEPTTPDEEILSRTA
ncbi:MAG TPA: hypothetical protein VGY58_16700 [Gemmataceae bacterium]|jgi:hypothetical protein|nr:hypothetical protein [Gemmataceae bacterium]